MEHAVTTIPRTTLLCMAETITTVVRKSISLTCVEDKGNSPPKDEWYPQCLRVWSRTRSHNRTRYNNLPGNRPDSRRHSFRGSIGDSSDRSSSGDCYRSPSRDHYRLPSRSNRHSSTPYYNMHYHKHSLNTLHFDSLETAYLPRDGTLEMDTAQDGQTMSFITLFFKNQFIRNHCWVKVDTDAEACTTPLTYFKKMFPHRINSHSSLTRDALLSIDKRWIGHNGYPEKYMGQIILDVSDKRTGRSYPTRFYIFEDVTSPLILISYAASDRLVILQFNLPNTAASAQIDTITTQPKSHKCIMFSTTDTIIPLIRTIHNRTNAYKAVLTPPSKTIILKPLTTYNLYDGSLSQIIWHDRQHAHLLHYQNRS